MSNKLLLGSSNPGKLKEIKFYLNYFNLFNDYEVLTTKNLDKHEEPVENASTFEENANIKSQFYFKLTGNTTISDDSGFIIDELHDYPGIKTARVAKELGGEQKVMDHIFSQFKDRAEINATFYCSLSLVSINKNLNCLGSVKGKMIPHQKGNDGFGYDPYFIPNLETQTYAEMTNEKKMISSHRFSAFQILSNQI